MVGMGKSGGGGGGGGAKSASKVRERERGVGKEEADIDAVLDRAWKEANAARAVIGWEESRGKESRSDHFERFKHRQRR